MRTTLYVFQTPHPAEFLCNHGVAAMLERPRSLVISVKKWLLYLSGVLPVNLIGQLGSVKVVLMAL